MKESTDFGMIVYISRFYIDIDFVSNRIVLIGSLHPLFSSYVSASTLELDQRKKRIIHIKQSASLENAFFPAAS
jgi:hypothetical protein